MKTISWRILVAVMAAMPMTMVSCDDDIFPGITGHGEVIESVMILDDFNGFVSAIGADIYLAQGDKQEVVVKAQSNIIDNIELDVFNGIWAIKYDRWVHHSKPVVIYITVPNLTKAAISGSGDIRGTNRFTGLQNLNLTISGSGSIFLDSESRSVDAVISGAGDFNLEGLTDELVILVSGSGDIDAFDLQTKETGITITGSGNAYLSVSEYLKVHISGSGNVYYRGTPEIETHVSGSGKVKRDR